MNKRIGILGMGRVGRTLTSYLIEREAEILLYDDNPESLRHKQVVFALESGRAKIALNPQEFKTCDIVIKSPGIPADTGWIKLLDEASVCIIDEIEFVWRELGRPTTVAITGTNGKSTTTAWISEVLKAGGKTVFCGGNIAPGRPFSEALGDKMFDLYVIEISTFQLERCPTFHPQVGVLLNVTADHLNRHSLEEYVNLKLSLFKNHESNDIAVLNADDININRNIKHIHGKHSCFSLERKDVDAYLEDDKIVLGNEKIIERNALPLPGMHNAANALATTAVAGAFKLTSEEIRAGLTSFAGLPHRMQYLGELEGRKVYNNSMCTNPSAFYHSVRAFDEPSVIIAGGTEKSLPLEMFFTGVRERAKYLVLFGENAEKLKVLLNQKIRFSSCVTTDSLRAALQVALKHSLPQDRIIFAPGFASFGHFKNFEERGNAFIQAYRELRSKT